MLKKGVAIWMTGLSGAGKTTIGQELYGALSAMQLKVELLDGDVMRSMFSKGLGFSPEDRATHNLRVGYVAELLVRHGVFVIVACISPYRQVRDSIRLQIGNFMEVYVDCAIEECERRDVKGLYKKVRNGEIRDFTGLDAPYEPPLQPDVVCATASQSVAESTAAILHALQGHGYLSGVSAATII